MRPARRRPGGAWWRPGTGRRGGAARAGSGGAAGPRCRCRRMRAAGRGRCSPSAVRGWPARPIAGRCRSRSPREVRSRCRPGRDGPGRDRPALVADLGPAVLVPAHRLEVHDPPERAAVLEVQEPVLAVLSGHPRALVGAVHIGVALFEDDALLVGPEGIAGAEGGLPAVLHPARGREDPVPAVLLVELGAFEGAVAGQGVAVDDDRAAVVSSTVFSSTVEEFGRVVAHAVHGEAVVDPGAALRPAVHEVGRTIVGPQTDKDR